MDNDHRCSTPLLKRQTSANTPILYTPDQKKNPRAHPPPFLVHAIIEKHGANYIHDVIRLTWQEFQELYHIVKDSLEQHGRGRRRKLERIDAFFVAMLFLTSGSTVRLIAVSLKLFRSLAERFIATCLDAIQLPSNNSSQKAKRMSVPIELLRIVRRFWSLWTPRSSSSRNPAAIKVNTTQASLSVTVSKSKLSSPPTDNAFIYPKSTAASVTTKRFSIGLGRSNSSLIGHQVPPILANELLWATLDMSGSTGQAVEILSFLTNGLHTGS
jgi:hypothetical protein